MRKAKIAYQQRKAAAARMRKAQKAAKKAARLARRSS
jgi:hypothetical protein